MRGSGARGRQPIAYNRDMFGAPTFPAAVDVAVVGRGPVGTAAALAIARLGRSVALIAPQQAQPPAPAASSGPRSDDWDNRVFALSPATRALLEPLGVWGALEADRVAPVYEMQVQPASAIRTRVLRLSAFEAALPALAWIVESRVLTAALERALSFSAVRSVQGEVAALSNSPDGNTVRLELTDGRSISARLVVAADGAQSPIRTLAGIEASLREYPQRALVANFNARKPHRDIAWQWFGEHGILALLPLPADTESDWPGRCSIVWSAPHTLADELQQLEPAALADRVCQASGGALGELKLISPLASWPLRLGRVHTLIGNRLALIGDAAHVVHPLAGQGMNLGFGDVSDLIAALRDASDPGARLVLRRYERSRAEPVMAMRLVTDGLQRLFDDTSIRQLGPLSMPITLARDLGWQLVAGSSWLRRRLVDHAAHR